MSTELSVSRQYEEARFITTLDDSIESKAKMYNSRSNPDFKLSDLINKHIEIIGFCAEPVTMETENGKEGVTVPRCTLFGTDGKSYVATSFGIFKALNSIVNIFGVPSEKNPFTLEIVNVTTSTGRKMLDLKYIIPE